MQPTTILITHGTGTIAQAIAHLIRTSEYSESIRLIGIGSSGLSTAISSFDSFYVQPSDYNDNLGVNQDWLLDLCASQSCDLGIPCSDYEAFALSTMSCTPTKFITASSRATSVGLDKYQTYREFSASNLPIARSYLPSQYDGSLNDYIAKPRIGGLSVGVLRNPPLSALSDDYLIQEFLPGDEISFSFYVTRCGEVLGPIAFERVLRYGITFFCVRKASFEKEARELAIRISHGFSVRGPCNIQGRFDRHSNFQIMEMNCRFSGTCSIRAQLGFNDVAFLLDEYVGNRRPTIIPLLIGGAYRTISDTIVMGATRLDELLCPPP
jgi:carbamoyl-phosphate synthase large subunit